MLIVLRLTSYLPVSKLKNAYEVKIKVDFLGLVNSNNSLRIHPKNVFIYGSFKLGIGISSS
jgi:hypothetical protein